MVWVVIVIIGIFLVWGLVLIFLVVFYLFNLGRFMFIIIMFGVFDMDIFIFFILLIVIIILNFL